jgi:putative salt-induced outer membrane protein YdiY
MTVRTLRFPGAGRIFLLAALLAGFCSPAQASGNDVVIMNNGDHFTGQVKRLENGLLFIETDYVSSAIGLDWNQVKSIQTSGTFRITLNNGQRLAGKIEKLPGEKAKGQDLLIKEATEEVQVPSTEIANIDSKKPTFWRQLQGSIDFGYSFTSGNNQTTLNTDGTVAYKTTGWEIESSYGSTFNGQSGTSQTNRQDLQTLFTKFLNRNSYLTGLSDFLHSSQQDLDLRTTLGGGYGRFLKRTTNTNLAWLGGVVYIHEAFNTIGRPSDQHMEAVLGLQYSLVRFNFGEFDSQLLTFPGLTDAPRLRVTTNNSLSIKLRNNFYLNFTFWDNFDSMPPETAKRNELGMSSGIGWTF